MDMSILFQFFSSQLIIKAKKNGEITIHIFCIYIWLRRNHSLFFSFSFACFIFLVKVILLLIMVVAVIISLVFIITHTKSTEISILICTYTYIFIISFICRQIGLFFDIGFDYFDVVFLSSVYTYMDTTVAYVCLSTCLLVYLSLRHGTDGSSTPR